MPTEFGREGDEIEGLADALHFVGIVGLGERFEIVGHEGFEPRVHLAWHEQNTDAVEQGGGVCGDGALGGEVELDVSPDGAAVVVALTKGVGGRGVATIAGEIVEPVAGIDDGGLRGDLELGGGSGVRLTGGL